MNDILKFIVEFIGTFIFLATIIVTGSAIPIGIALATSIYWGGSVSGGHFNPSVSIMMFLNNKINAGQLIYYIVAQILGGICALMYYKYSRSAGYLKG